MPCPGNEPGPSRRRREPERGAIYQVLLRHLQSFLARADERIGPGLPDFARRELYSYLDCGISRERLRARALLERLDFLRPESLIGAAL